VTRVTDPTAPFSSGGPSTTADEFVAILDVEELSPGHFVGTSDAGSRRVVDGSQVLAQSIVAAAKTLPGRSIRSARATFMSVISAEDGLEFDVDVHRAGRQMAFADVVCRQGDKVRVRTNIVLDHPAPDVIRHEAPISSGAGPADSIVREMPLPGRELRLDGIVDENSPHEVGPPEIRAWLRYDAPPQRDDLAKALVAHFTGHLSISTSMRGHAGIGTADAHKTVSTGPLVISIAFHEPFGFDDWILYLHDSTFVGAGMTYVRGQVHTEAGHLIASFTQEAMIRGLTVNEMTIPEASRL
jgi:acyl-CoA thioesterase-2